MNLNFEIVLNYAMTTWTIQPPSSFTQLREIAQEKYDLTIVNRLVYYDNGEEVRICDDSDYIKLFDYVDSEGLTQIDLIIKSDENKSKRKKSTQIRKNSNSIKPPGFKGGSYVSDDNCINDYHDNDYEVDIRNNKLKMEEGNFSKHSYNQKDQSRIFYIQQKKEIQREEQKLKESERLANQISDEEEDNGKNKKKRVLKSHNKVEPIVEEEDSGKNGKNFYKNKKK